MYTTGIRVGTRTRNTEKNSKTEIETKMKWKPELKTRNRPLLQNWTRNQKNLELFDTGIETKINPEPKPANFKVKS